MYRYVLSLAATALFLLQVGGCAKKQEGRAAEPTEGWRASQMQEDACPMTVEGADVAMQETGQGVALLFTTESGDVGELKQRVRRMSELHNARFYRLQSSELQQRGGGPQQYQTPPPGQQQPLQPQTPPPEVPPATTQSVPPGGQIPEGGSGLTPEQPTTSPSITPEGGGSMQQGQGMQPGHGMQPGQGMQQGQGMMQGQPMAPTVSVHERSFTRVKELSNGARLEYIPENPNLIPTLRSELRTQMQRLEAGLCPSIT